ncbi:Arabidopsis Toxicos en Levadura 21 [Hibiscus trionum]|uniref:RING-type E3 ubiquitin transferase n=1 Tax=Hibiscus trionum TaxID=183268 RepID=A0A9W7ILW2_HIBTR|nr:Arabidopsis Toxicos en Levadura 21 [Hibiscus trionum]
MDILIFFSFLFPILSAAAEPCSITKCGKNEVPIRFPFHQLGKQSENCGYAGFNLGCKSQNTIHLKLPNAREFYVCDINYLDQQIDLYDLDDCLPRRFLSFSLHDSPFVAVFHQNYTFLSCPTQVTMSQLTAIGCLSNSTHSV